MDIIHIYIHIYIYIYIHIVKSLPVPHVFHHASAHPTRMIPMPIASPQPGDRLRERGGRARL
jgi:hypothetical protein